MAIAKKISESMNKSSFIRKMFEEGARLKALHGAENVFDFSLGNPNLVPPPEFKAALFEAVEESGAGTHSYMPNVGYPFVRKALAEYLSIEHGIGLGENDLIMTCGAAGALNVVFKTLLDPGDEVLTPAPYFVEYNFYVDNHGGALKTVTTHSDFTLDLPAMDEAITEKTKAVLINSPNNPTGQIYSKESLDALGALLREKGKAFGRTIYLISDEPYRKIVYDGQQVPSIFSSYTETIIATSYSKDISVPGERIGFLAVHPGATFKSELLSGMALCNRILGFVNAPALMQRVMGKIQGVTVDITQYEKNRKLFCEGLARAGYDFTVPPGAFYLFPRSPIEDDVAFVRELQEELILVVPGSGFGGPGHFRIAYCCDEASIVKALPGFQKVMAKYK
ncbi:MAG: pyridoxal phosphate-dependent aminotransferase [Proteobacteria bacterium]|nr:pyridoxal phosphate-dependent aminotransferase [Pseudomonadota bacterium]